MIEHFDQPDQENNTLDNLMEGFQLIGFDWRYHYVNKAVVTQGKHNSKSDLLGYTMMQKYPGIENTELFKVLQHCMKKRISKNMENEFTFPDNSKGWFELRIEPVPKGLFILSLDITERKKAEELKKEHIEGLEEMIFMTSHKIRQPITQILGVSSLLQSTNPSQPELNKIAGYMKESVQTLDVFTRELTSFIHAMKLRVKNRHRV